MSERLMDVNAYTTFDLIQAVARGHGWREEGLGTLNVTDTEEGNVVLEYEFDATSVDSLPQHAVGFEMSPEEARTLVNEIEGCLDKKEEER